MISAMPAVAVRRERKKQRAARASAPPSVHSSFSSLSQPRGGTPGSRRSTSQSVSTISSTTSSYVSALHRVRERQLEIQRERSRFFVYTGSVLITAGLALIVIGLAIAVPAAQTIGLLFVGLGSVFCLAKVFCFQKQIPLVKKARTISSSGQSIYNAAPSTATTPGTEDSTTSSYYFSAVPMHRLPTSPSQETTSSTVHSVHRVHSMHSVHSNPSSILTPMSLNSIPEMQVLITDDSKRIPYQALGSSSSDDDIRRKPFTRCYCNHMTCEKTDAKNVGDAFANWKSPPCRLHQHPHHVNKKSKRMSIAFLACDGEASLSSF